MEGGKAKLVAYIVYDGSLDRLEEKLNNLFEQNKDRKIFYIMYQDITVGPASVLVVFEVKEV